MTRPRLLHSAALSIAVALLATFLAAPIASATPTTGSNACSSAVLVLRTLHVEAVPSKKVLKPGDTFSVDVTVTSPAREDPVGQGIEFESPVSVPAEGVTVGLSVWVGERTYFWQVGMTDAEGKETLKLKVPANAELGEALASVSARHWIKNDCPDILEDGYTNYAPFVTIKR